MASLAMQERFQSLVEVHRGILFKVCNAYCRDPDDREDLAQEILYQLWRSFGRFDERQRFSTWMYRVALNVAISHHRRDRTRTRHIVAGEETLLEVADERTPPDPRVSRMAELIAALDPLQKSIVLLHLEGFSHRDIGEFLGTSESNIGTRLSRIRAMLRNQLEGGESQ
jgi:RNA polymerase sigma factor (sigma-70 family)